MNIAIMADIHGNHIALEACIGEARKLGAEEFLFLGDYLGELAYPERAILYNSFCGGFGMAFLPAIGLPSAPA